MPTAERYQKYTPEEREARAAAKRAWRANNPEKVRAQESRYREKNREKYNARRRAKAKTDYHNCPEKKAKHEERQRRYRQSDKGRTNMNAYTKHYRKEHEDFYLTQAAKSALADAVGSRRAAVPPELIVAKASEYKVRKAIRLVYHERRETIGG